MNKNAKTYSAEEAEQTNSQISHKVSYTKSSFCNDVNCVEVAKKDDNTIYVRDSKNPSGAVLSFTHSEWDAFVRGVHNNEFNL